MTIRINYIYYDQALNTAAHWVTRSKDFSSEADARLFIGKIYNNVSVRDVRMEKRL